VLLLLFSHDYRSHCSGEYTGFHSCLPGYIPRCIRFLPAVTTVQILPAIVLLEFHTSLLILVVIFILFDRWVRSCLGGFSLFVWLMIHHRSFTVLMDSFVSCLRSLSTRCILWRRFVSGILLSVHLFSHPSLRYVRSYCILPPLGAATGAFTCWSSFSACGHCTVGCLEVSRLSPASCLHFSHCLWRWVSLLVLIAWIHWRVLLVISFSCYCFSFMHAIPAMEFSAVRFLLFSVWSYVRNFLPFVTSCITPTLECVSLFCVPGVVLLFPFFCWFVRSCAWFQAA